MASIVCNALIFAVTLFFSVRLFRKDGKWNAANGLYFFRYFTVLSNVLCAFSALLMCLFPAARGAWLMKYIGTAAVSVTLLTVLFFLGPTMGYDKLFKGSDLFMHLLTPLMALFSFCVLEKRGLGFAETLLGVLPVIAYGVVYAYKILKAPREKAWEDFYGFNRGGKWPVSMAIMFLGAFGVCVGLMLLQNL